jgi:hypothetical protein
VTGEYTRTRSRVDDAVERDDGCWRFCEREKILQTISFAVSSAKHELTDQKAFADQQRSIDCKAGRDSQCIAGTLLAE